MCLSRYVEVTRMGSLSLLRYGDRTSRGRAISFVRVSESALMVKSCVSLVGSLRRSVLAGAWGLPYWMCCYLPKYSKIIQLGGLGLRSMIQEVVGISFMCWDDGQVK